MLGILIAVISAGVLICILMALTGKKSSSGTTKTKKNKNSSAVIKECTKKLQKDPHNIEALKNLADVYYTDSNFEKAEPLYQELFRLMGVHPEIDQNLVSARFGISAYRNKKYDEALAGFSKMLHLDPRHYESNLYAGLIMIEKKEFDKAIMCLKRAIQVNPESKEGYEPLAYALFDAKKYRECLPLLKRILDENPDNKQALFDFASAMLESGMGDKCLKIFMHLRPDPTYGAKSCIECGNLHEKAGQRDKALQDYEIALKLETIAPEDKLTVLYKMAQTYLNMHNIASALKNLKLIQSITPNYKDVNVLVTRYQELNQNNNLQAYLMSGTSDFVVLCRKFVTSYYADAFVKVEDVNVASESIEVLCTVESSKWTDKELFRFFRSTGAIGELYVRDCHSKMRDIKCDRGFCVTAGSFTEEAKKYVEGRPIDLIEKVKLVQLLKKIV